MLRSARVSEVLSKVLPKVSLTQLVEEYVPKYGIWYEYGHLISCCRRKWSCQAVKDGKVIEWELTCLDYADFDDDDYYDIDYDPQKMFQVYSSGRWVAIEHPNKTIVIDIYQDTVLCGVRVKCVDYTIGYGIVIYRTWNYSCYHSTGLVNNGAKYLTDSAIRRTEFCFEWESAGRNYIVLNSEKYSFRTSNLIIRELEKIDERLARQLLMGE